MLSVYRTLSVRYLRRRWFRAVLIVCSIALGVATLVATRALNETMTKAGLRTVNPFAGVADLIVSNGSDSRVSRDLAKKISVLPGVKAAHPRIFKNVKLPDYGHRAVLVIGIEVLSEIGDGTDNPAIKNISISKATILNYGTESLRYFWGSSKYIPAVVGKELDNALGPDARIVKVERDSKTSFELIRTGSLDATGAAAVLAGNVLILDLSHAAKVVGLADDQANRIDVVLSPGANLDDVRRDVEKAVRGQGNVRTPSEQDHALGNVLSGMQTGFSLCGLAALVVGLFLVYNTLAVCVAERRHEIGVLLSLGATRRQIQGLFGGEALLLGLAGSLLGIPLGLGLAALGLEPVQDLLRDIFMNIEARQVEVSLELILASLAAGTATALAAALIPAILASHENPAEAVRRVLKAPDWRHRAMQLAAGLILLAAGLILMALHRQIPSRLSVYGGLVCVLLSALVIAPLITALGARLLLPVFRRFFPLEWRLAADNVVQAPGRTGLVIAALAAGVALVVQTAGTIRSNRIALREWVQENISSDLIVTSGSPVGAGGQTQTMNEALGRDIAKALEGEVEAVLPLRLCKITFGEGERATEVLVNAVDAAGLYAVDRSRRRRAADLPLYKQLSERSNAVIVSENFAALHGKDTGDVLILTSQRGRVELTIIGKVPDYSWNHGSLIVNRADYVANWQDDAVDVFDIFVRPGVNVADVRNAVNDRFGEHNALCILTREELQSHIDNMIERLYGFAYAQQLVVMLVAALGVIMALLISVLQRRREMGLLRAIGASRAQIIRSVLAEAVLMGVFGALIGVLVGIPLEWYVLKVLILEESGYLFPLHVPWLGASVIAAAALTVAALAGLGPALHAVRERIPSLIAYE